MMIGKITTRVFERLACAVAMPALALMLVSAAPQMLSAAPFVYDGFDYTAGNNLVGESGGNGWSGAWLAGGGTVSVLPNSLAYTDSAANVLVTAGGSIDLSDTSSNATDSNRTFDPAAIPASLNDGAGNLGKDGTSVWMSFLSQKPVHANAGWGGLSLFEEGTAGGANGGGRVDIGEKSSDFFSMGFPGNDSSIAGGNNDPVATTISLGPTAFVLARVDFKDWDGGNGSPDEIRMWVNPLLDVLPNDADADAGINGAAFALFRQHHGATNQDRSFGFDRIRLAQGSTSTSRGGNEGILDEVRFGATFADVTPFVPEPTSLFLAACAMAMASVGRRRRL